MRSAGLALKHTVVLLVLSLSACVPGPRTDEPAAWVGRTEAILELPAWTLNGRIGLQVDGRGFNGSLIWQQTGDNLNVDFRGPFGAGAFRVSGLPDELVLETGDGRVYILDDPETTLVSQFGWGIPLDAMRYWLTGIAQPGYPADLSFDPAGRLVSIEQLDWIVQYERFSVVDGWEMPRKLVLHNSEDVRVKLVISRWSLTGQ